MRNLKRALSLALASVMLMGMMVVGSSAASFPDVGAGDNTEAISVLNAVGVMLGDEDTGNFRPEDNVTRNEMAVILAKLILGSDADKYVGNCPFTDVPTWAQKYVAACYDNKIVAGRTESLYDGSAVVTAQEAAAMVLRVLGYQKLEDQGTNWAQPVVAKANEIRLFTNVGSSATAPLNRNQVAQLSLNALKSDVVTSDIEKDIVIEGVVTIPGKVTYNKTEDKQGIDFDGEDDKTLQLCEKLYEGDLKLTDGTPDGMGRPGIQWSYKNDAIGTYATNADRTIVVDKGQTLTKELEDANKNWKVTWSNGGATTVKLNGADSNTSANVQVGDVVEIYMDDDVANAVGTVAITRYSVDEVTGDIATKGSGDDLQVRIPGFVGYTDADKLNGDYNALEKDDVIYYYKDSEGVYTFAKADSFEGTYSGDKTGTPAKHIIDGDNYVANGSVGALSLSKQTAYTFYTDANGYLILAQGIEEAASDYVVIQDIKFAQGTGGITGSEAVEARLVQMDGTVEVVKVASVKIDGTTYDDGSNKLVTTSGNDKSVNTAVSGTAGKVFFTYSVNSDKEYELTKASDDITQAALANDAEIKNGEASMENVAGVAVNKNTIFVIATENGGKEFKVYNGINEVPNVVLDSSNNLGAYVAESGIATHVYVGKYKSCDMSGDTVFFLKADPESKLSKKDGDTTIYYNTYKAIVDGEYTLVEVKADSNGSVSLGDTVALGLFTPAYNSDGMITKITAKNVVEKAAGYKLSGGSLLVGNDAYTCANDTLVFIMDEDGNVTESAATDITEDKNDTIYVVKTGSTDKVVDFLVIVEVDDDVVNKVSDVATTLPVEVGPTTNSGTNKPGDVKQELQGEVEAGIPTGEAATALNMGNSMDGKKITTSYIEIPKGTYGIRQTNELFKDTSVFTSGDNGLDTNKGTKTKKYEVSDSDKLYFMIGEDATITFEFDWDYTGEGENATFEADYTITITSKNLTIN